MSNAYDWTRFQVHSYVAATPEEVYRRWATAEGLESFFIRVAEAKDSEGTTRSSTDLVAAGDEYYWKWWHDYELRGSFLEATDEPSVTFTFGEMKVKVTVHPSEDGALVRLEQYDIPSETEVDRAANHLNCRSCWVFYMANLKSVCETGYDLRDHNPDRSGSASVDFQPKELG